MLPFINLRSRPTLGARVADPPLFGYDESNHGRKASSKYSSSKDAVANRPSRVDEIELNRLRQKKAWDLALAPAKQVPMQAFMMWMSGSGVQIFSVMMVYMLIKGAITASFSVNQTFQPFESTLTDLSSPKPSSNSRQASRASSHVKNRSSQLFYQKLTFVACQSLLLILGLWKVNGMGLLPTRLSDWIMYERRPSWAVRDSMNSFTVHIP